MQCVALVFLFSAVCRDLYSYHQFNVVVSALSRLSLYGHSYSSFAVSWLIPAMSYLWCVCFSFAVRPFLYYQLLLGRMCDCTGIIRVFGCLYAALSELSVSIAQGSLFTFNVGSDFLYCFRTVVCGGLAYVSSEEIV